VRTIKLLLNHGADLEARNSYGGTALGQALWSAVHSRTQQADRVEVVKTLIEAGARIEEEMLPWLLAQKEASPELKQQLQDLLTKGR
jgi:ankyrin repeat protein